MSYHSGIDTAFDAADFEDSALMKVLVVDDSAIYRKLIGDHLRSWDFEVILAEDGSEAKRILDQPNAPKLVLLDWVLPDMDGTDLCKRIRETGSSGTYVYVILLTSKEGKQNMLRAMQAGADDYLVKPFDELELKARLLVGKRILDLQDQLVLARESMHYAATHDSLTTLMNRSEVVTMLLSELARARRERNPIGVILADIDHFKAVNDTLGHLFGDEALRQVGHRLRDQLRIYDSVGRYGGEEFLMVLPNCDVDNTFVRANELREFVARTPVTYSGQKHSVTLSMGVTVSEGKGEEDAEFLIVHADLALYAAKRNGRNRVERFTNDLEKAASARTK
jgi:two-component system, cell cycle response regulator